MPTTAHGTDDHCSTPMEPALVLWGKSHGLDLPYPLTGHLMDTAAAARVICEKVIPAGMADVLARHTAGGAWADATVALAGWHDIGKATCGFQNQVPAALPVWLAGHSDTGLRHDVAGCYLVFDRLAGHDSSRMTAAQIVGGHHGIIPPPCQHQLRAYGGAGMIDHNPPAALAGARAGLFDMIERHAGAYPGRCEMDVLAAAAALAVVVLADWLVSQDWLIERQQEIHGLEGPDTWCRFDPAQHYKSARGLAGEALREAGLLAPPPRLPKTEPSHLLPDTDGGGRPQWRDLQASINDGLNPCGPGIVVICAPTGEGKTEAAVIAAAKQGEATGRHGFYFAMPTRATADGLHERLSRYVARVTGSPDTPVRRVHSAAQLDDTRGATAVSADEQAAQAAAHWMAGTRKAILAPWGVGTIDQVLLGAMRVKHSPLRLFGAATGTVVIDEAHALDPYMRELLVRAVEWLAAYGASVVVCSATLPPRRVSELIGAYQRGAGHKGGDGPPRVGYPGWMAWSAAAGYTAETVDPSREWALTINRRDVASAKITDEAAAAAVSACAEGGCVLVVRSTVRAAQDTYDAIRAADGALIHGMHIDILHSRMPMGERRERTEKLMRAFGPAGEDSPPRPERFILVATQIVEQSLDLDFDTLITDPAPAAQVLQRAGRVHRRGGVERPERMSDPEVLVLWPLSRDGEPSVGSPIYHTADLQMSRRWLAEERTVVAVPGDVPRTVAECDIETRDEPDPHAFDGDDMEEATLARLVAIDTERGFAARWRIPPPHDAYLDELTSSQDDADGACPGTRQGSHSVMLVPADPAPGAEGSQHWRLHDGTTMPVDGRRATREDRRRAFNAAIPVNWPGGWIGALPEMGSAWRGTPLADARVLSSAAGRTPVIDNQGIAWRLEANPETGLHISRISSNATTSTSPQAAPTTAPRGNP